MCETRRDVSLGFTDERYPAGTHMCLIFDNEEERREIISRFLNSGVDETEKVAYFADVAPTDETWQWLHDAGLSASVVDGPSFRISDAQATYCPDGRFDPDGMLETLRAFHRTTLEEGYPGGRVSGEMTWARRGIEGSERLIEYEARVNDVLQTHPVTAICQYDARRFDGATILDVLRVHPMMVVRGQVVHNPYYVRTGEWLAEHGVRAEAR